MSLGRNDEAIAAYQQAIALDPKYAYPHNGLGNVYRSLGRNDEAIAAYQQAIALDPKFAYPHNGLGNVYSNLGRNDEAIAAYQQAIALDAKDATAHGNLASVYIDIKEYDRARTELGERIRLMPDNTFNPLIMLGVIDRHQGRVEAKQHFQTALAGWDVAWRARLQTPGGCLRARPSPALSRSLGRGLAYDA